MSGVSLTLAAATGGLSVLNPCGFPLLPSFLSFYASTDDQQLPTATTRVGQGLHVGALVTAGFLGVFSIIGLPITLGANAVARAIPFVGLSIGLVLVAVGLAATTGRTVRLNTATSHGTAKGRSRFTIVSFGAGYGLASLGCTLPLFLTLVATSLSADGTISSIITFAAYGAGMSVVVMALSLAAAFARQGLARALRRVLPWLSRGAGLMLTASGTYLTYYWWRLRYGETSTLSSDPIVGRVTRYTAQMQKWATHQGGALVTIAALIVATSIAAAVIRRHHHQHVTDDTERNIT